MSKVQKNEFNISGKVIHVGMPEHINTSFAKRKLVLEVWRNERKQEVMFEFINKNMSLLNQIREGDWVNVDFMLGGSKSLKTGFGVWFNNCEGISCTKQD